MRRRSLAALVSICTLIAACSGGDSNTGPSGGNNTTVTASGGRVASADGNTALVFPAGAVPASTTITITPRTDPTGNEFIAPGSVNDFGPDGTQFAQPVALTLKYDPSALNIDRQTGGLRISKLVNNVWQPITEALVRDSVAHTVTANIHSFSTYGLAADPCFIGTWGAAGLAGQISKNDCLYSSINRHSDYFNFSTAAGKQLNVTFTGGFNGLFGVKQQAADPTTGLVWGFTSFAPGTPQNLSVITAGGSYQLFISGVDSLSFGSYTATSTQTDVTPVCGSTLYITPGATSNASLTAANACSSTVNKTTINPSFGQPTYTHTYTAKLEGGKQYLITANTTFPGTLTVYNGGGGFVGQSTNQISGAKTVSVTPPVTTYFVFIVESGSFTGGQQIGANWARGTGTYTLSVSP